MPTQLKQKEWTLNEAISFLHHHKTHEEIRSVESFFEKKVQDTESKEQKAESIYYLIKCKLFKHLIFETKECNNLYIKLYELLKEIEEKNINEYKKNRDNISKMQLEIFYLKVEHYFGNLSRAYKKVNFTDASNRAYVDEMNFRKDKYRNIGDWFRYGIYAVYNVTSHYGNSLGRWLFTTVVTILVFALAFYYNDLFLDSSYMVKLHNGGSHFDYFYYSMVTFTTLGYGDIVPITVLDKILAMTEVMVGYLMLGILVNLLGRKL